MLSVLEVQTVAVVLHDAVLDGGDVAARLGFLDIVPLDGFIVDPRPDAPLLRAREDMRRGDARRLKHGRDSRRAAEREGKNGDFFDVHHDRCCWRGVPFAATPLPPFDG